MRKTMTALIASTVALATAPAVAQTNNGLVVVDLSGANIDLLNNLARDLNISDVDVLKNIQVSVPIGVAAAICDVNANILAAQRKTEGYTCTAKNNTAALTKAVAAQRNN